MRAGITSARATAMMAATQLFLPVATLPAADAPASPDIAAIVVNVTRDNLDTLLAQGEPADPTGGRTFAGHHDSIKGKFHQVDYTIGLSRSHLDFAAGNTLTFSTSITAANIHAEAAYKMKKNGKPGRLKCRDLGITLDPARPVPIEMNVALSIEDGDVALTSGEVRLPKGTGGLTVEKPGSCRGAWILNPLVKHVVRKKLRKKVADLQNVIGAVLERTLASIGEAPRLAREIDLRPPLGGTPVRFVLRPVALDTSHQALWIGLALDTREAEDGTPNDPQAPLAGNRPPPPDAARSYLALSESTFRRFFRTMLGDTSPAPLWLDADSKLSGALRSSVFLHLFPAIGELSADHDIAFSLSLRTMPQISFASDDDARTAWIDLQTTTPMPPSPEDPGDPTCRAEGFELGLWNRSTQPARAIGSIFIGPHLRLIPSLTPAGKLTLGLATNTWQVCARGVEGDSASLARLLTAAAIPLSLATHLRPLNFPLLRLGEQHLT
ncbi:MAG: hypothetical protein ACE5IK_11875, partial [Acidobacteriota bacterium]